MRQRSSVQSLEAHPRLRMLCGLSQPSPVVWALRGTHAHECLDLLETPATNTWDCTVALFLT